ncbi:hypothetical protein [Eisenibacter elegans]|uniref:hypothetical protein n=1 Tax=Eisenibacter elegans TaxID=997 RepID=UPI000479F199|nr:hypothetical protein [Eisenibacter elegans]
MLLIGFGVYLDSPILFFAAFWISIGFVSYFSFRRWVRYFISQIRIDKAQNTCEIQYFDYDSPQMLRLPLSQVAFKIERIQARGPAMYNLCVYEGNKSLLYQKCGIGYWSKENCEALVHTLS